MVFYISQVFFETNVKGASGFVDVEFGAFGAMNNVHNVVYLADELLGAVHLGFSALDVGGGTDEGARCAFPSAAWSSSWSSGGLLS